MRERDNRYRGYGQYDPDEPSRYDERNRAARRDMNREAWERDTNEEGWAISGYSDEERYDERDYDASYGRSSEPRARFDRRSDDQTERAERYRPAWQEPRWQEARDRDRVRQQRERSYGSGVSGQYWTRESATRPEFRALGIGGLQQGGFSSYAGMEYDPWESRHLDQSRLDRTGSPPGEPLGASRSYYGRGPKGYTRSDERIREDASERLYADAHVDASEITVVVQNGEVTLVGSVETRRQKHRAENLVDSVPGVKDVHNQLRVTRGGVMSQIAEKVQQGVDRLTGHEPRRDVGTANPNTSNNRSAS